MLFKVGCTASFGISSSNAINRDLFNTASMDCLWCNSTPIGILNLGRSEEGNISSANTLIVEQLNSVAAQ